MRVFKHYPVMIQREDARFCDVCKTQVRLTPGRRIAFEFDLMEWPTENSAWRHWWGHFDFCYDCLVGKVIPALHALVAEGTHAGDMPAIPTGDHK